MAERTTAGSILRVISSEPSYPKKADRPDWQRLCVCGHLEQHHSASVGGTHPTERTVGSQVIPYGFDGCTGAMRNLGRRKSQRDPTTGTSMDRIELEFGSDGPVNVVPVTCPCKEFRPVAEVDRLGGRFRARVSTGPHPMVSGVRSMWSTVRKMAEKRGDDPEALFDSRFRWTVDLVCERCLSTEDVFPSYTVLGKEFGLLCQECRDKARATVIL